MRRVLMTALVGAAAISFSSAASAVVTLTVPDHGPDLSTAIHASASNTQNDNVVVYGSTVVPANLQDVTFTGNTAVHITGGSGFAAISDVLTDNTLFTSLTINPDPTFNAMEFTLQLVEDGTVSVFYTLVGGVETLAGTFAQNHDSAIQYLLSGGNTDVIDSVRVSVSGGPILEFKQNSINLLAAVPEPGTWAMMLLGFAGIGMAVRRTRRSGALLQIA